MGMQIGGRLVAVAVAMGLAAAGCAARKAKPAMRAPAPAPTSFPEAPTPVPTVPLSGSTASPGPTRTPTPKPRKAKPGEIIGPEITFLGITRADGKNIDPVGYDEQGRPIYESYVGSGFQLVVEGKPGKSGDDVGRRLFAHSPTNPTLRPDLEIQVNRPLGDGSPEVCDRNRPHIGGVPGIDPPSFAQTQKIADALNDLSCRFELFAESQSACTLNRYEDWEFKNPETTVQFCMMVARAWSFPVGKTLVSARLRDRTGNPGPIRQIWISRPATLPTVAPPPTPTPKPKKLPVR